jgi:hypothetical protein
MEQLVGSVLVAKDLASMHIHLRNWSAGTMDLVRTMLPLPYRLTNMKHDFSALVHEKVLLYTL